MEVVLISLKRWGDEELFVGLGDVDYGERKGPERTVIAPSHVIC